MTLRGSERPDVGAVLRGLKDFQRDTVEYIFDQLYGQNPVSRFLIADEVGLGKTLVARGLIAKAVDHLWDTVPRIDVIYICSNQEIAQQNIDRLNITADREFQFASRATLLPVTLKELKGNKLNFVSLTPETSFRLRSRGGWRRERAVLYALLDKHWDVPRGTLRNVLRGDVKRKNWRGYLDWFQRELQSDEDGKPKLDPSLSQAFYRALDATPHLRTEYETVAQRIGGRRKHLDGGMRWVRNKWIGKMRRLLAQVSLAALEPDLIILDEFQRFKYLLSDEGDVALLAQELFNYTDEHTEPKILLLSATPYKMYTLRGETDENHYDDFLTTVQFLYHEWPERIDQLEQAIRRYRRGIINFAAGGEAELAEAKETIEGILRQVMVRTERLAATADRNGMLREEAMGRVEIRAADLAGFVHLDKIARTLKAGDQVEHWKSSAYPLNLMDDYKLKRELTKALKRTEQAQLAPLIEQAQDIQLQWSDIQAYEEIEPGNARLRGLWQHSVETGNWQFLWMPPSLPYYRSGGLFADAESVGCTKTLIFSAWKLVPKTIAMLTSYEAERRMVEGSERDFAYDELTDKRRPLLRFARSRGRLTGMPVFCLIYPCLTLAQAVDPFAIAREQVEDGPPSAQAVYDAAKAQVEQLLSQVMAPTETKQAEGVDEAWYWAALALLDRNFHQETVEAWWAAESETLNWPGMLDPIRSSGDDDGDEITGFAEHVSMFTEVRFDQLGAPPADLADVVTLVALCSPAVATLRAFLRIIQPSVPDRLPAFLAAAAGVGFGFRTLFNQPEAICLLQQEYPKVPYWEKALRYSLDGNLQAVMDEYCHVLYESLGLVGHASDECALKMSRTIQRALSLRAPTLRYDEYLLGDDGVVVPNKRGIRCRYALRFGSETSADWEGRTRDVDVRVAFNSPFRPFVLATTSIGQEGLDFHQYCHRVVHWNLPSNPVDLEQREGRVHRFKGHVIRRNLAAAFGLPAVESTRGSFSNPWEQLFHQAEEERPGESNDLVPFWIFEAGSHRIERKIPLLPLSQEKSRLERLKKSLVAYRSVIGQPRQQELVEYLAARLSTSDIQRLTNEFTIDLSPPVREAPAGEGTQRVE